MWDRPREPFWFLHPFEGMPIYFFPAFVPLSTTGMVILLTPLSSLAERARSLSLNSHFIIDDRSLRCAFVLLTRFFQFLYIDAEGETLP